MALRKWHYEKRHYENGEFLLRQLDKTGKFVPSIPPSSIPPSISKDRERKENSRESPLKGDLDEEGRNSVENRNEIQSVSPSVVTCLPHACHMSVTCHVFATPILLVIYNSFQQ
jgi:hypothetical protein